MVETIPAVAESENTALEVSSEDVQRLILRIKEWLFSTEFVCLSATIRLALVIIVLSFLLTSVVWIVSRNQIPEVADHVFLLRSQKLHGLVINLTCDLNPQHNECLITAISSRINNPQ